MNRPIDAASGFGMSPVPPADGPKDQRDQISPREHLTTLVEDMLVYRANPGVTNTFLRFPDLSPQDLLTRLRNETSLGLLIPDGEEMPRPSRDNTVRLADSAKLIGVAVTASRTKEGNYRRRQVAVEFLSEYEEGDHVTKAAQILTLEDDSKEPVRITIRKSATVDLDSEEAGYDPGKSTPISDEQVIVVLGIVGGLFTTWKESPEGIDRAKRLHVAARISKTPQK